jgi:hypothetical protein
MEYNAAMKKLQRAVETHVIPKVSFSENLDILEFSGNFLLLPPPTFLSLLPHLHIGKIDTRSLLRLSPFSTWLVTEFSGRSGISHVYEQITFFKISVISIPMQPTLNNFILAHVLLRQLLGVVQDPKTLCNKGEVCGRGRRERGGRRGGRVGLRREEREEGRRKEEGGGGSREEGKEDWGKKGGGRRLGQEN